VWYNKEWQVGKLIEVDENDNGCLVTFKRPSQDKTKGIYFISNEDELWLKHSDFLQDVQESK
jgi:hypothetical protein